MIDLSKVKGSIKNDEIIDVITENDEIRVEHVAMPSKVSPHGFWYDVDESEWGMVLQGYVEFEYFENKYKNEIYKEGDSFFIKSHQKHRIVGTSLDCIVLCVFVKKY